MIITRIWKPDWSVVSSEDAEIFQSMDTVLATPMEKITYDSISGVSRVVANATYYVKVFSGKRERVKQLLGISRYDLELRNLAYFARQGLNTPSVAASGSERLFGFMRRGMLVTVEVSGSTSLEDLIDSGSLYDNGVQYVRSLLKQLAQAVKLLHEDGFFHRDLKTRNILVQGGVEDCRLFFFDCPSGHHPVRFLRKRGVVRDLAYLERGLRGKLRNADMLFLFREYRGVEKLAPQDRQFAQRVLAYYGQRRMTRERKQREELRQWHDTKS